MGKNKKDDEELDNEAYIANLQKRNRNIETEKQLLDAERLRLEQELHSLRNEIDRLREPPLMTGVVVDILDENKGRVMVMTTNGPSYVVYASRKVKDATIKPGMIVLLNQRTFAIMEIVNIDPDQYKEANESIYKGIHSRIHNLLIKSQTALLEQSRVNEKLLTVMEKLIEKLDR